MRIADWQRDAWRSESNDDDRFAIRIRETKFVILCEGDQTQFDLWWRWHEHYRVPWEEEMSGMTRQIATVVVADASPSYGNTSHAFSASRLPLSVTTFWARLGRTRVAFVQPTSQLVVWPLVEAWAACVFTDATVYDNANNFHIKLQDIERHAGEKLVDHERHAGLLTDDQLPRTSENLDPQKAYELCEDKLREWSERAAKWQAYAAGKGPRP